MAAEVVQTRVLIAQGHEVITVMDDYGTELLLQVNFNAGDRQAEIDDAISLMSANQTSLEAYAAANSIDLTTAKAAGLAKKQALLGTTPSVQP